MSLTARTLTANEQERSYMPIRLKRVLFDHRLQQSDLAAAVLQERGRSKGRPMSVSALSLLINYDSWPTMTPRESIRGQVESWLRDRGVPDEEIADVWKVDPEDPAKGRSPARYSASSPGRESANDQTHASVFEESLPEKEMLTSTARQHFKLFRDPFQDDVQSSDDIFMGAETRYIREAMFQTAKLGGFLAVVGESGAGKTTLRRDLLDRIHKEDLQITVIQPRVIDKGRLTSHHICDAIVGDVSQEQPKRSLEAKARQIERLLTGSSRAGNSHVLMIEEAHDLTIQTLKYLKRFWELEDGFRKLLAIILIGQLELKAKLDERQNWEAREVIRRCEIAELEPLNGDLEKYLELKFKRQNVNPGDVLDGDVYDAIRQRLTVRRRGTNDTVSMHYPLVVNNLVVKAMNLAASVGSRKVTSEIVQGV